MRVWGDRPDLGGFGWGRAETSGEPEEPARVNGRMGGAGCVVRTGRPSQASLACSLPGTGSKWLRDSPGVPGISGLRPAVSEPPRTQVAEGCRSGSAQPGHCLLCAQLCWATGLVGLLRETFSRLHSANSCVPHTCCDAHHAWLCARDRQVSQLHPYFSDLKPQKYIG